MSGDAIRVGWIGLGNMGWPMAANLVKAGYDLIVNDLDPALSQRFAGQVGGEVAPTAKATAAASDVLVTMVPNGKVVKAIMTDGADAAMVGMGARDGGGGDQGGIVIDMSSSDPIGTRDLAADLLKDGVVLLDAPVSGGVPKATDGTLAIMLGGEDAAAKARVMPLLETMGGAIFETGPTGSGHAMKALNNYLSAIGLTAANEALMVGQKFGLDPRVMTDVINASTGRNSNTERKLHQAVIPRTFDAGFATTLMAKDLRTAYDLVKAQSQYAPVMELVSRIWTEVDEEFPGCDHTASIQWWEKRNDIVVGDAEE